MASTEALRAQLESKNQELENILLGAKEKISDIENDNKDLEKRLDAATSEVEKLKNQIEDARKKLLEAKQREKELVARVAELKRSLLESIDRSAKMQNELEALKVQKKATLDEIEQLRTGIADVIQQKTEVSTEIKQNEELLKNMNEQQLQIANEEARKERELKSQLNAAEYELKQMQLSREELEQQIRKHMDQIDLLLAAQKKKLVQARSAFMDIFEKKEADSFAIPVDLPALLTESHAVHSLIKLKESSIMALSAELFEELKSAKVKSKDSKKPQKPEKLARAKMKAKIELLTKMTEHAQKFAAEQMGDLAKLLSSSTEALEQSKKLLEEEMSTSPAVPASSSGAATNNVAASATGSNSSSNNNSNPSAITAISTPPSASSFIANLANSKTFIATQNSKRDALAQLLELRQLRQMLRERTALERALVAEAKLFASVLFPDANKGEDIINEVLKQIESDSFNDFAEDAAATTAERKQQPEATDNNNEKNSNASAVSLLYSMSRVLQKEDLGNLTTFVTTSVASATADPSLLMQASTTEERVQRMQEQVEKYKAKLEKARHHHDEEEIADEDGHGLTVATEENKAKEDNINNGVTNSSATTSPNSCGATD